ncbi:alpha/beta fold hydrolase [Jeotgalibacillus sp. JSM ZJ347]|uniref:alpha/beta fold hydrolase n=1 Tax=Jeotgalibacillus sp. JSM ZJ347 TaxID=3342117 RepID=UPI0035A87E2A
MKESFYTRTSDGHDLYTVVWRSDQSQIKGSIQLCHGMAEHIGRYDEFALRCNQEGFHVFGHDCRGHGNTAEHSGRFGDFGPNVNFTRLAYDVMEIRDRCLGTTPVYLVGHSMGSFIVRRVIQLYSTFYDGVVLSGTNGPMGIISLPANLIASIMSFYKPTEKAKLLNKLSFGSYNQSFPDSKTPFDWLSSDEKAVQQYIDDPLCGFITTNRFYKKLFNGISMIYNKKAISDIRKNLPILFVSGEDDPVGDFGKGILKSANIYQNAGIQSVEVHLYENGRHEMLNELNSDQVIEGVFKWIKKIEG